MRWVGWKPPYDLSFVAHFVSSVDQCFRERIQNPASDALYGAVRDDSECGGWTFVASDPADQASSTREEVMLRLPENGFKIGRSLSCLTP